MHKRLYYLIFIIAGGLYAMQSCNKTNSESYTSTSAEEPVPDIVSYNFDVRPILSDKCYKCHGPDASKREAGLRLDLAESAYKALKDNPKAHALVPGSPDLSQVFVRISTKDSTMMMPPPSSNLPRLNSREVDIIEKWIKQGAKYEKHWAFVAPVSPAIPEVKNEGWAKNEIDYFILRKQEQKGMAPNEEADKEHLLKRVSLDITGLPPGIEMMDRFLADKSANAYEKIVDQLLKDRAYGEQMAVHWMDVARYADSHGYQDDNYRSQWPWRDWVIHAFNENMHYDDFISWQLAGDLMPPDNYSKERLLATGFNRNHKITEEGGVVDEEYRVAYVADRTATFGKALLGVTVECATCHDHKYDPIMQKEYYQLSAFFNNVKEVGIEATVGAPKSWVFAKKPMLEVTNEDVKSVLKFVNKQDTDKLVVSVMGDRDTLRKTFILRRGVYDAHGEEVEAGTPKAILPFSDKLPKNRLGLSKWLFDKKNPLTSRVFVNQMWQEYFGSGIVKTPGDFGMQGELPSHPELLDWLAVDFMNHDWDIKRLVKQMVTSATYRQSAVVSPEKLKNDPNNIFLARGPRNRVQAEFVRDIVLASSGLLNKTIGGPSVNHYQPPGLWEAASSGRGLLAAYRQDHGSSLYRRGLYTLIKRTVTPPTMGIFDASNRDGCEVRRLRTNTPLQALVMMNDPTVLEASRVLAAKLIEEKSQTKDKIAKAFRLIVCRKPNEKEIAILTKYYNEELKVLKLANAEKLVAVGEYPLPENMNKKVLAAMMQVVSAIYNLEETITKS